MHTDPLRHRSLKAAFGIPDDAIIWHDPGLPRHYERWCAPEYADWCRVLDPEVNAAWRKANAEKRAGIKRRTRKPQVRLAHWAKKTLEKHGRPSYAVLMSLPPAKEKEYRPCLGWTKRLKEETGIPSIVWLPWDHFGPSKQYWDGLKRQSRSWVRRSFKLYHDKKAVDLAAYEQALIESKLAVAAAAERRRAEGQRKVDLGLPEVASLCRNGCHRYWVENLEVSPMASERCLRCTKRGLGQRYPIGRRVR